MSEFKNIYVTTNKTLKVSYLGQKQKMLSQGRNKDPKESAIYYGAGLHAVQ